MGYCILPSAQLPIYFKSWWVQKACLNLCCNRSSLQFLCILVWIWIWRLKNGNLISNGHGVVVSKPLAYMTWMQEVPGSIPSIFSFTFFLFILVSFCCNRSSDNHFWTHYDLKYMASMASMHNPECKTLYVNWTSSSWVNDSRTKICIKMQVHFSTTW